MLTHQIETALHQAGLDPMTVGRAIKAAFEEDLGSGPDATTDATVPVDAISSADFVARAEGVVAGLIVAQLVIAKAAQGEIMVEACVEDGTVVKPGTVLMTVRTKTRALLTAERTALNFLCHLSGIATATRHWVDAVEGSGAKIRDTRKTTPGLRALEKYAVRCGGGVNHRMSLSDAAMVKDNHVVAAGGVVEAFKAVRAANPELPIEVEVDSLDQIPPVLEAGAELILLDNFSPDRMRAAVLLVGRNDPHGRTLLEASGGLKLEDARDAAATGVDYISVGALTHSAPVLDIGLDFRSA